MSGFIYCLYSSEDGVPRYVGRTNEKVSHRFKQHVTSALEQESGPVYDWIWSVWRDGHDIGVHTLQMGVVPKDMAMYEQYWIEQFAGLTNVLGNTGRQEHSEVAKQVIAGLSALLAPPKAR